MCRKRGRVDRLTVAGFDRQRQAAQKQQTWEHPADPVCSALPLKTFYLLSYCCEESGGSALETGSSASQTLCGHSCSEDKSRETSAHASDLLSLPASWEEGTEK